MEKLIQDAVHIGQLNYNNERTKKKKTILTIILLEQLFIVWYDWN